MRVFNEIFIIIALVFSLSLLSCCKDEKEKGCNCSSALNYNKLAEENDGTCVYSNICFYARYDSYNYYDFWGNYIMSPVARVEIEIFNSTIGTVYEIYPNGPDDCNASGTVQYRIHTASFVGDPNNCDFDFVNFTAHIYLVDGTNFYKDSRVTADHDKECIMVNVTL